MRWDELRDAHVLKHWRVVRKWASEFYDITTSDLEVLIYLYSLDRFKSRDFENGEYTLTWDKRRWYRLKGNGWIKVFRHGMKRNREATIYECTYKAKKMIIRIYKLLAGEEDIPVGRTSPFFKNKSYTDKVYNHSIDVFNNDPLRKGKSEDDFDDEF